jgi:hypothetical protein
MYRCRILAGKGVLSRGFRANDSLFQLTLKPKLLRIDGCSVNAVANVIDAADTSRYTPSKLRPRVSAEPTVQVSRSPPRIPAAPPSVLRVGILHWAAPLPVARPDRALCSGETIESAPSLASELDPHPPKPQIHRRHLAPVGQKKGPPTTSVCNLTYPFSHSHPRPLSVHLDTHSAPARHRLPALSPS